MYQNKANLPKTSKLRCKYDDGDIEYCARNVGGGGRMGLSSAPAFNPTKLMVIGFCGLGLRAFSFLGFRAL